MPSSLYPHTEERSRRQPGARLEGRKAAAQQSALMRDARSAFAIASIALLLASGVLVAAGATGIIGAIAAAGLMAVLLPLLDRGLAHHPHAHFGGANRLTLARAVLTAGLMGRALDPLPIPEGERWVLAAIAALALALDGFDGWLARRQQLVSDYGGRFDIEIDAVAVLALSLLAWRNAAPLWVLAIGGMRYLFLAAGLVCPGLGLAPTASDSGFAEWRRKVIGVAQHLVLIASLMPAMPSASARFACALALLLLIYSFAADAISGGNKE